MHQGIIPVMGRYLADPVSVARYVISFCSSLAITVGIGSGLAAAGPVGRGDAVNGKVDRIFAAMDKNTPGCAVAASRNGEVIIRRAYGMANLELGVPIAPDSIFEAGSSSKQFTAAIIWLLARQGRINLSDDIRKYLPEMPMPDYGKIITIGDMVHHISGIQDWGSLSALAGWPRFTRTVENAGVLALVARQKTLNFPTGEHYLYSNSNYNLLPIIASRATGVPFEELSRKLIFEPLGMVNTSWRSDHLKIVPGRTGTYVVGFKASDVRAYGVEFTRAD
jgi:CubicO group peptidase (beta-lactamase class C family)